MNIQLDITGQEAPKLRYCGGEYEIDRRVGEQVVTALQFASSHISGYPSGIHLAGRLDWVLYQLSVKKEAWTQEYRKQHPQVILPKSVYPNPFADGTSLVEMLFPTLHLSNLKKKITPGSLPIDRITGFLIPSNSVFRTAREVQDYIAVLLYPE